MTDKKIKKSLECCLIGECESCPIRKFSDCYETLKDEAISLINRQQERIEELEIITGLAKNRKYYRKFVDEVFCKQEGRELSEPDFDYIYQLYFEQQAEIERLQNEIKGFDNFLKETDCSLKEIKDNAIKEFAEKVVNKLDAMHDMVNLNQKVVVTDAIITVKQIAKEMVGEQDA